MRLFIITQTLTRRKEADSKPGHAGLIGQGDEAEKTSSAPVRLEAVDAFWKFWAEGAEARDWNESGFLRPIGVIEEPPPDKKRPTSSRNK